MDLDDRKSNSPGVSFPDSPDPSNNEEFLDKRLVSLRDRYSYEELSDLSARRLGALKVDDDGLSERDFLHKEFKRLRDRFPNHNSDDTLRRVKLGDDYQGLAPLTLEQKRRIQDCHHECSRNLDRASQDALEREDLAGPLSRFAAWLIQFIDAATPIFYKK